MTSTKSEFSRWFSVELLSKKTMYHVGVERDEVQIQLIYLSCRNRMVLIWRT